MSTFADTSALVKLYVDEEGHDTLRHLRDLVISQLSRVEVVGALWRAHRRGGLSATGATTLIAAFEADYTRDPPRFAVVAPHPVLLDDAARLTGIHGLRAYDAVQLASARAAAAVDDRVRGFAAFDSSLRDAAAREGFLLVPP